MSFTHLYFSIFKYFYFLETCDQQYYKQAYYASTFVLELKYWMALEGTFI